MTSRLLGQHARRVAPYIPGEQPQDRSYIKLNTNESPFPPSPAVEQVLGQEGLAQGLRLYPDPDAGALARAVGDACGLPREMVFCGGGSDEVLGYAFMAFADPGDPVYFPDITYGFYQVYADLFGLDAKPIPLAADFTVRVADYLGLDGNVFLANPNAPTGIALTPEQLRPMVEGNRDRLVVIDEAYIDFAPGLSCVPLTREYDNLLVVQTCSKSRCLAGMRLGFAFGQPELIQGLERMKYSFNPYNLDRVSLAVGAAAVRDGAYLLDCRDRIIATRSWTRQALEELGLEVLPSQANFLFARYPDLPGEALYRGLRDRGILVRHFDKPRISDFIRLTIGTRKEMTRLVEAVTQQLKEEAPCVPQH